MRGDAARTDFSAAGRFFRRREFVSWGAVRLVAPPESQPHAMAAVALVCYTDDICDRGPVEERARRFEEWAGHVRNALDTGQSKHRLLRAYLHSAGLLNLSRTWLDSYMAGIRIDPEFPGFPQEADCQRYIETVTLPALVLCTAAVPRLVPEQVFSSSCRLLADGTQRADFLTDLFEDLRDGRLFLPVADLERHGVTRTDLLEGRDTPGVRALLSATEKSARVSIVESERILGQVPPGYRPILRFLIGLYLSRLDDVVALGAAATRRPCRDRPVASVSLLLRSLCAGGDTGPVARPTGRNRGRARRGQEHAAADPGR
ncbi:hypothetical protein GCM10010272_69950 [Streptomyces lateritius]|nr:hypothetical protein GCM10010272_69950 [Streptomyces lateritius]